MRFRNNFPFFIILKSIISRLSNNYLKLKLNYSKIMSEGQEYIEQEDDDGQQYMGGRYEGEEYDDQQMYDDEGMEGQYEEEKIDDYGDDSTVTLLIPIINLNRSTIRR